MIAGVLAVSCSDDDKSISPTPQLGWASLGTGMDHGVGALTVFDNKLIAGGNFTTAVG